MAAALMEMEELVEAFLLRLPPDDPASLVRAALVCKLWRRILAGRGFRRRFCELHRRPPMLGFSTFPSEGSVSRFTPTSSFRPRNAEFQGWLPIDSHHGRVLLARSAYDPDLAVWDPISGDWQELPKSPALQQHLYSVVFSWSAAVLCASSRSSSCDSIDCHRGHFLVVLMVTSRLSLHAFVYSSQDGTWSETTSAAQDPLDPKYLIPLELSAPNGSALAGNALHFKCSTMLGLGILKYDLGIQEISWIDLSSKHIPCEILLTTTESGGLGIARVESENSRLHLWSGEAGCGGLLGCAPSRVIQLRTVLPANSRFIRVLAFVHGLGAFLVSTDNGVFSVDLESNGARKVSEDICGTGVVPYMCFLTPAPDVVLTNTGGGSGGANVPSA